jgi:hypothetical protein
MSAPTPRTDSEEYPDGEGQSFHVVSADFARTLERELATERKKVRVLRSALENLRDEQNDAPLEIRRWEWQLAMDICDLALATTEDAK